LKAGAGVTNIGTSAEGTYNPSKARILRSPRGVGNNLSSEIDPLAKKNDGTIYRILRTFILDPTNQAHLRAQLNLTPTSPLNLTHTSEPRYATLLYDLGTHWLPADFVDLYFDWPAFSMTCLSSVILTLVHGLRDIPTMEFSQHDMFHVAKFVLEYANDGRLIKSPMGFWERDMAIRFAGYA
jgi:hypothetical protein